MRRLAIALVCGLFAALAVGDITNEYVRATRVIDGAGYFSNQCVTKSAYENLVGAWTADFPVQDVGTTNAVWLGWSLEHNDGIQTTITNQPTRTRVDGTWVWDFDGASDNIGTAYAGNPDDFRLTVRFKPDAIPAASSGYIATQYDAAVSKRMWALSQRTSSDDGVLRFYTSDDGTALSIAYIAQADISANMATYVLTKNGGTLTCTIDGDTVTVSGSVKNTLADKSASLTIGASATPSAQFAGQIEYVIFEVLD